MRADISWDDARSLLEERLTRCGINFPLDSFWPRLEAYFEAFEREASGLKLTAIKSRGELIRGPVFESLFLASHLPLEGPCADLGTGAGIPGFIVKIARPELQISLLEAYPPRVEFLKQLAQKLKISGIEALCCHVGFEGSVPEAPVALARGYGSVDKFVLHAAKYLKARKAFYLWRKDVEPWKSEILPLKLVKRLSLPERPVELLYWQAS